MKGEKSLCKYSKDSWAISHMLSMYFYIFIFISYLFLIDSLAKYRVSCEAWSMYTL
jgi:hypothetical protein